MSQTVNIPVACIGEACKDCEYLEIEKDRYVNITNDMMKSWGRNVCYCKHVSRCETIFENLRKNSNADNEKDGV